MSSTPSAVPQWKDSIGARLDIHTLAVGSQMFSNARSDSRDADLANRAPFLQQDAGHYVDLGMIFQTLPLQLARHTRWQYHCLYSNHSLLPTGWVERASSTSVALPRV
ncbi:hypothetical protein A0H81_06341 [Grifola frondosa]|uniref:Uncharacterized protein n=1 Tax=Grifola frondosa TaxID=5627 RepID=A0A1C7M9M1_GRIFR|nr:hypothetical protein A0H81_06341 [Grifola frondosa]